MLEARKLTKIYPNGAVGLSELDLTVAGGEIVCLLGANGAGKTTTINLFLDFIQPTSGACVVAGITVAEKPLEAKKSLAYLAESVMLYGNFTAFQNLSFFARVAGRTGLARSDFDAAFDLVGLPRAAREQRVSTFSKGMRQKVGIAIAIIKNTTALILDEPMSGLDPKAAAELVATLRGLRAQGKAILMSTHDIFRAKSLADRIAILSRGRKLMERRREELEHEDLEQLYLRYIEGDELVQATTA